MSTASASRSSVPVFLLALVGLVVTGGWAIANLMSQGHAAFNASSTGLMWGLPIVTYDFFLLTSTGLTMVASLWTVFGITAFEPIARRCVWLAVAGLVGGVAALFLELGHPLRALYAIPLSMQFKAPLFWKVIGVVVYIVALAMLVTGWLMADVRGRSAPRFASRLALLAAVFITFVAGLFYGMLAMRPFWFGGDVAVAFLIETFVGGLAFAVFFTYLAHGFRGNALGPSTRALFSEALPKAFAAVIALHLMFVLARLTTGLWSNADGLQVWHRIAGSWSFHLELWVGLVLPLLLMALPGTRRQASMQIIAALLVMVALFAARYQFVVGGQLVPLFKGAWVHGLIEYTPSLTEWLILGMSISLANVVNAFGEWRFFLGEET